MPDLTEPMSLPVTLWLVVQTLEIMARRSLASSRLQSTNHIQVYVAIPSLPNVHNCPFHNNSLNSVSSWFGVPSAQCSQKHQDHTENTHEEESLKADHAEGHDAPAMLNRHIH